MKPTGFQGLLLFNIKYIYFKESRGRSYQYMQLTNWAGLIKVFVALCLERGNTLANFNAADYFTIPLNSQ